MRVLKFSASWCQPCNELSSRLHAMQNTWEGLKNIAIEEYDIDEDSSDTLVEQYGIKNIPTLVMIGDDYDDVILKTVGALSEEQIKQTIIKATEINKKKREA